jgi:hypothetical protein
MTCVSTKGIWFLVSRPLVAKPLPGGGAATNCAAPCGCCICCARRVRSWVWASCAACISCCICICCCSSFASAAASVVKGHLKVAQLGCLRQPLVLLGVGLPGQELSLSLSFAALAVRRQPGQWLWGEPLVAAAAGADLELHFPSLQMEGYHACLTPR